MDQGEDGGGQGQGQGELRAESEDPHVGASRCLSMYSIYALDTTHNKTVTSTRE